MEGITVTNLWALILAVASGFVLLANAGEKIAKIIQGMKAPNANQDKRLDDFSSDIDIIDATEYSFSRFFKRVEGMPPARFRMLLRSSNYK